MKTKSYHYIPATQWQGFLLIDKANTPISDFDKVALLCKVYLPIQFTSLKNNCTMQTYLNITVNDKTGNLEISATPEGMEYLDSHQIIDNIETVRETREWDQSTLVLWSDLLESYSCNGGYNLVPDNTFALTDPYMVIIADYPQEYNEAGECQGYAPNVKFWAFTDYAVVDELEKLLNGETITLIAMPVDNEENVPKYNIQDENVATLRQMYNANDYSRYTREQMENEQLRREQVRKDIEAKKLTPTQQLQFILKNNPDYSKYEIEKIYQASFCKALDKALPYTHFSNGSNYLLTKYKVDYEATIKQEATRFEKYIQNDLRIGLNEFKSFYYLSSLFTSYGFTQEEGNTTQFRMDAKVYTNLVHLIQFLNDGIMHENYAEANKFCDEHKIRYFSSDSYQYTIGSINVKRYKNGRLDITGLNDANKKFLANMFRLNEIIRKVR